MGTGIWCAGKAVDSWLRIRNTLVYYNMNQNPQFHLNAQRRLWIQKLKSEQSITYADTDELKRDLQNLMNKLMENSDLDEEEAFIIATRRMGMPSEWGNKYRQENVGFLNIRRTAVILAGVLVYYFVYHLIGTISRALFLLLSHLNMDPWLALGWTARFLITAVFIFITLFAGIYSFEQRIISFIDGIHIQFRYVIWLLVITFFLGFTNISLGPLVKSVLRGNNLLLFRYGNIYRIFDYSFAIILCIGFIIIYLKYYRKAKI